METQRFIEAENVTKEALAVQLDLTAQNPTAYRPDVAGTLGNLGVIYSDIHRFSDAESALKEALAIRRDLAAQNPAAYRPGVAKTLDNLGNVYRDTN